MDMPELVSTSATSRAEFGCSLTLIKPYHLNRGHWRPFDEEEKVSTSYLHGVSTKEDPSRRRHWRPFDEEEKVSTLYSHGVSTKEDPSRRQQSGKRRRTEVLQILRSRLL